MAAVSISGLGSSRTSMLWAPSSHSEATSSLQTSAASTLRKLSISMDDLSEVDRNMIASFLTSDAHYTPQSQEIIGILKQMLDEMMGDLKDAKAGLKQMLDEMMGDLKDAK